MPRASLWARLVGGAMLVLILPALAHAQAPDAFNPIANSGLITVAIQQDGKILIGGGFTALGTGGSIPRSYIARLNTDGSVDSSFNPGADGFVRAISVQGNGQILVGGDFGTLGGATRQRIGRLNADGTIDPNFNPGIKIELQAAVSAIAVQTDGRILVGGTFSGIGGGTGTTTRHNIARLNSADGSVDGTYDPGASLRVLSIALQTNGSAIVGGLFSTIGGGGTGSTARSYLARLDNTGTVDPDYNANVSGGIVNAVAIQADGKALIGGNFSSVGGQLRQNIARVNNDLTGTVDANFNPGASSTIESFAIQADGKIIVGGGFSTLGGQPRSHIGRLNSADGTVDGFDPSTNTNGSVYGLALQEDGKVVAVGGFTQVGGITRSGVARLFNDPATQSLTLTGGSTITWLRGGSSPEIFRAAFHTTTDGTTFTFRGYGARIAGGWQLTGLSIPSDPNLRVRGRGFYQTGDRTGSTSVYDTSVPPSDTNVVENNDFSSGTTGWSLFSTPNSSYMTSLVSGGVFQFYRLAPPPGTANQAVVFQSTGLPVAGGAPVAASFQLGNTDSVRKRISVLVHDSDFTDLHVCTFWLPAGLPLTTYGMRTHTTKPWANMTISFYAASANAGANTTGFYLLDNVSVQYAPAVAVDRTECLDAIAPAPPGGPDGGNLLANGDFASGAVDGGWGTFGQISGAVNSGVFEFIKLAGTPAGVILQQTTQPMTTNQLLTATFDLGNSSAVRKRVTVLVHDSSFADLSACTFWLAPGQPLSTYTYRTFATQAWADATVSVYPATVGAEQWIRLDNVTLKRTPAAAITGAQCLEPGAAADARPAAVRSAAAPQAPVAAPTPTGADATGTTHESATNELLNAAGGTLDAAGPDEWLGDGFAQTGEPAPASLAPSWVAVASETTTHTLTRATPIDLAAATGATLRFDSWLSATHGSRALVQISLDGVTWETVQVVAASDTWTTVDVDLGAYAGTTMQLRFVLEGVSPTDAVAPDVWRLSPPDLHPPAADSVAARSPSSPHPAAGV